MEKKIDLKNIYLRKLAYDNHLGAGLFMITDAGEPSLSIENSAFQINKEDNVYEINLGIGLEQSREGEPHNVYSLIVTYSAIISFVGDWTDDEVKESLFIDGASMLFPYVRETFHSTLGKAGMAGMYPPPIDFEALYEENKEQFTIEKIS